MDVGGKRIKNATILIPLNKILFLVRFKKVTVFISFIILVNDTGKFRNSPKTIKKTLMTLFCYGCITCYR